MWFEEVKTGVGTADWIRAEAASREGKPGEPRRGTGIPASAKTPRPAEEAPLPAQLSPFGPAGPGRGQRARAQARVAGGWGGSGRGRAATVSGGRGLRRGPAGFSSPASE